MFFILKLNIAEQNCILNINKSQFMETTVMTPELEAQINSEFAELSGTSDSTESVQEVEETETQSVDEEIEETEEVETEESEETETEEADEETSKESKTEKKIKKLLSKKNKAEREKQSLEERLAELEQREVRNDFINENPDAKDAMDKIEQLMEDKNYDMEDAYAVLKAKWEIKTTTPSTKGVGIPKQGLWKPKDISKMNTNDLESMLKSNPDAYLNNF